MMPVFELGLAPCIVLLPFVLFSSPFSLCVCCHSIVGLVLCFSNRVVSLWNSGGGLCWVERCVAFTVHCQLLCVVVCISVVCVVMAVCDGGVW